MATFPAPPSPSELAAVDAEPVAVTWDTLLWRVHSEDGPYASRWGEMRHYGPVPTARFDHHLAPLRLQHRGVVYLGLAVQTCIAEVFQDSRAVDRAWRRPWLVGFRLTREVRLLDLTGTWPTTAGASQAISSGRRDRAREWARAIYEAYPDVEGLWYRSAMNGGEPAMALWERAAAAVPVQPEVHLPLDHPGLEVPLARIAGALRYRLL